MLFAHVARRLVLLSCLPIATLSFACGGGGDSSKKVDLEDWVADLCEIAADFEEASDKAGEAFDDADVEDTKEAKKAFAETVKEQKEAQKDFRTAFGKIGQPDIEDGDKVVDAFKDQFDVNEKVTNDIAKAIADIDDDDDFFEAFLEAAVDFEEPDFLSELEDLADDSDDVQDLIDEIADDDDCAGVIFQGSSSSSSSNDDDDDDNSSANAPKTDNEKWVAGVCSAFTDWVENISDANVTFQAKLDTTPEEGPAIKKVLVDFLKIAQGHTEDLDDTVSKLKAPDVKDGKKVHDTFVDTTGKLVEVFDDLVSDANKIDTANTSRTLADVTALSQKIGTAFEEAGAGFDKLDDFNVGEVGDLFESRPECAGF